MVQSIAASLLRCTIPGNCSAGPPGLSVPCFHSDTRFFDKCDEAGRGIVAHYDQPAVGEELPKSIVVKARK